MSVRFVRNRNNQIPPVQFQQSPEITYWAKKHNLTPHELEEAFVECNFSMIKAIEMCKNKMSDN
ncbi:MAG: hypothetical protein JWN76_1836 [Chitinophagaceae bacterium]|nr:hypothetical protein [Chitinophagaceae bacterium]